MWRDVKCVHYPAATLLQNPHIGGIKAKIVGRAAWYCGGELLFKYLSLFVYHSDRINVGLKCSDDKLLSGNLFDMIVTDESTWIINDKRMLVDFWVNLSN